MFLKLNRDLFKTRTPQGNFLPFHSMAVFSSKKLHGEGGSGQAVIFHVDQEIKIMKFLDPNRNLSSVILMKYKYKREKDAQSLSLSLSSDLAL